MTKINYILAPMAGRKEFPIGTKYVTRGKSPKECTIIDVLKTYNSAGTHVMTRYVASHEFMGQEVIERDVHATTVAMGLKA